MGTHLQGGSKGYHNARPRGARGVAAAVHRMPAAQAVDRSDAAALTFLQSANDKFRSTGKLSVRDFHMLGAFPMFEFVYQTHQFASMSYAQKLNATPQFLKALNTQF